MVAIQIRLLPTSAYREIVFVWPKAATSGATIPMMLASLAEQFGSRYLYLTSFFEVLCSTISCANTIDISTVMIFRFSSGAFGSVENTMVGGSFTDMLDSIRMLRH